MPKPRDSVTLQRTCEPYTPIYYAAASGDFNPIHIDPAVGEKAGLGGVILQGLCTMAWAAEAAVRLYGNDPSKLKKLRVRFSRPVKPGDVVTFTATAGEDGHAQISAVNQRGEDVLKNAQSEGAE